MPGSADIGLGAIISLTNNFSGPAGIIAYSITRLEERFKIASTVIKLATKKIAAGMALIGAGVLIKKAFDPAIRDATAFGAAMTEVSTLTDKTVDQMKGLTRELINQSVEFGKMPIESTKLLYQAISSGATEAADANYLMTASMKTATAGLADQTQVLDLLSAAIKAYGKNWSEADDISDMVFTTVRRGKTTVSELAGSMQRLFAPAAALGIPMEELFAVMSTLTGVTGSTSEVVTQFTSIMASLIKPTTQARQKAKELGLVWDESAARSKGFIGLMEELRLKAGGDAEALGTLIGRQEGITAALALTGKMAKGLNRELTEQRKRAGASSAAFEKMSKTMAFAEMKLAAARQALRIEVGKPLLNALRPITLAMASITQGIVNFAIHNPLLVKIAETFVFLASGLLVAAGSFLVIKGAMLAFSILPLLIVVGLFAIYGAFLKLKVIMWGLKILSPIVTAVIKYSMWTIAKSFIMAALPIAGLVAALYVLYRVFSKGKGIGATFRDIFGRISLVWTSLTELIETFDGKFGKMSKSTADKLKKAGLFDLTVKLFMLWARFRAMIIGVKEGFVGALDEMANTIRAILPEGTFLRDIFDNVAKAIADMGLKSSIEDWKETGKIIGWISATLLLMISSFKLATIAINIFSASVKAARLAMILFNTTMKLSPLGLAITLLTIAAIMVWNNRDAFAEFWKTLKETPISQIVSEFWGWLTSADGLRASIVQLGKDISDFWNTIKRMKFTQFLGEIGSFLVSGEVFGRTKQPAIAEVKPKLQRGTPMVERTGVAIVHKGEVVGRPAKVMPPRSMRDIADVIPFPRRRTAEERAAIPAQPTSETIELIVNLDGDVLARAMAERDRRMGLRQVQ